MLSFYSVLYQAFHIFYTWYQSEVLVAPPPAAVKPQAVVKPPRVEEHNLGAAMGLLFPPSFVKFKCLRFVLEVYAVCVSYSGGHIHTCTRTRRKM